MRTSTALDAIYKGDTFNKGMKSVIGKNLVMPVSCYKVAQ